LNDPDWFSIALPVCLGIHPSDSETRRYFTASSACLYLCLTVERDLSTAISGRPIYFTGRLRIGVLGSTGGMIPSFQSIGTPTQRRNLMAFRDLFLPKIAHSNPEKRKEAVREENDVALLKKVIANDSDSGVIEAAKQRIAELEEA
jgi:hypothetical protein